MSHGCLRLGGRPSPDRVTVAASSAVGVPAAVAVDGNSMGVAAGGADDVGAAVAGSPRQVQLALSKRRVG